MEIANDIVQTSDGGYVLTGSTFSNDGDVSGNNGNDDVWIVKTDDNGNLLWQKCLGGSINEEGWSVRQSMDSGYYIGACTTSNDSDVSGNHGTTDVWIVKLDSNGNIIWQKALGGTGEDAGYSDHVIKIENTSDGGCIVGSYTNSNNGDVSGNHGNNDWWLIRLDSSGAILWQRCYGGSADEKLRDLRLTSDGGYILVGGAESTDGDLAGQNYNLPFTSWIVKTDSLGGIEWQTIYYCIDTLTNCNGQVTLNSIVPRSSGGYTAAGTIYFYGNVYYYSTIDLSSTGMVSNLNFFTYQFGQYYNQCKSIQVTADSGYILSGQTNPNSDNIFIHKIGSLGTWDFVWDTVGIDYETVGTTIQSSDGGFVIAGRSKTDLSCGGGFDPFQVRLIKLGGVVQVPEENNIKNCTAHFTNSNLLYLSYISRDQLLMNFSLYDISGRLLSSQKINVAKGKNETNIFTGDFAKGLYFIQLSGEKFNYCLRVSN